MLVLVLLVLVLLLLLVAPPTTSAFLRARPIQPLPIRCHYAKRQHPSVVPIFASARGGKGGGPQVRV